MRISIQISLCPLKQTNKNKQEQDPAIPDFHAFQLTTSTSVKTHFVQIMPG
jgi:hypothetical protein